MLSEEKIRSQAMLIANRLVVAFGVALSAAFASQALAQPDVNPPPPLTGHGAALSEQKSGSHEVH
jgi:hypothetical protein